MKNKKILFSHQSDHWETPKDIYDYFTIKLKCIDPCPLYSKENNLKKIYKHKNIYINPPYSDIKSWVQFINNNIDHAKNIYLLIPARTDTKYFHELLLLNPTICFLKGRLKFSNKGSAPFPTIIMCFNKWLANSPLQYYKIGLPE